MRKSGLHKQIASIFDGSPMPNEAPDSARSLLHRLSESAAPANRVAEASAVRRPVPRPQPAPRVSEEPGVWDTVQRLKTAAVKPPSKTAAASQAQKRQKLMTVMVGVLSVVFVVALYIAFGGVGQTVASTAAAAATAGSPQRTVAFDPSAWVFPQPLPTQMRDPLVIPVARTVAQNGDSAALTVRGIVFSQTRPSAIVSDKVVFVGETVNGVKVVGITRDTVEFEKDDKRWTQGVQ